MNVPHTSGDDARAIRELLRHHGYTAEGIGDHLGKPSLADLTLGPPAFEHRVGREPGLSTLIRLFTLKQEVETDLVEKTLAPMTLTKWMEAGLITTTKSAVRAPVGIVEVEGLYITSDWSQTDKDLRPDHVLGVSNSSMTLANLTVTIPPGRVLDLGCGSGIQTLLAAEKHDAVTGSDSNARAIAFARFNLALNGIENAECVQGDLFESVEGKTFDLVVTNPPFVISPKSRFEFRDSPLGGEEICRTIVERAPRYLERGGFLQMLCNWEQRRDEDWRERLEPWFETAGCDGWVMRFETMEPYEYATTWVRQGEALAGLDSEAAVKEWAEWLTSRATESIGIGLITLRNSEKKWFRAGDAPRAAFGRAGDHILRMIEGQDLLLTSDDELLKTAFAPAPNIALEQRWTPDNGGWHTEASVLTVTEGLPYSGPIDAFGANLIAACDGARTLDEAVAKVAADMGGETADARPGALRAVRELVSSGFLVRA